MTGEHGWIAGLRPERELNGRWGIYNVRVDRWLDIVFTSEREAEEAVRVLRLANHRLKMGVER